MAAAAASEPAPSGAVQLLLRNIDSRTTVVRAQPEDTLDSVLERLGNAVARNLWVEYAGRRLQADATIGELGIPPDATLHVTSRLLSTPHPDAWNLAAEVAAAARLAAAGETESASSLERLVSRFLRAARAARGRKSSAPLGPVADHIAILLRSGVPGVIAQLYLSENKACRIGAERAIRLFLAPDPAVKVWTAPVLLDFCSSVAGSVRQARPLYTDLRSALAALLASRERNQECWLDMPPGWVSEHLTRLAVETADIVMEQIVTGAYLMLTAEDRNLAEFKIFLSALRRQVLGLDTDTQRGPWWNVLHEMLMSLLRSIDECMAEIDTGVRQRKDAASSSASLNRMPSSLPYLWIVLVELDAWSDMDEWPEIRIALQTTLSRHRGLLDFNSRRHLAMTMLPKLVASGSNTPLEMLIDRSRLLADSFEYIAQATPEELRSELWVEFRDEQASGPGVRREWFCKVFQALFNPSQVLFSACPSDRRRFFVNPSSVVDPLHLEYYEFAGRMIALALVYKIPVGVLFDRTLFLQLADRPVTLDDIADADPSLHASCKKILEMDSSLMDSNALGLTFVREVELLGSRTVAELISGGGDISVNSKNLHEYIHLLIQDSFVNCTRDQVSCLTRGFSSIFKKRQLSKNFFNVLDVEDFNQMLGGSKDTIDVKEWKAHTDYHGYSRKSRRVKWFWKIVKAMTVEQRRRLLFFWTSVEHLPFDGFSGLGSRLSIYRSSNSCHHLPTSGTCFYQLKLPPYTSFDQMEKQLQVIVQEHVSSSFGKS